MKRSPEAGGRLQRNGIAVFLAIVAAGAAIWTFGSHQLASIGSPTPAVPDIRHPGPRFVGASADRIFLSAADSLAAEREGLLPPATRSVLATGGKLQFGEWRWDDQGVPAGPITVRADLTRQLVSVFKGRDEIGTAVIVYGIEGKETPRGKLPILGKVRDYHSITYDAPMPYTLWLRRDGVALHGSAVHMGKATNGCIGVPIEFAEKLFEVAQKGDIVEVIA